MPLTAKIQGNNEFRIHRSSLVQIFAFWCFIAVSKQESTGNL